MIAALLRKLFKKKPEFAIEPAETVTDSLDDWEIIPIKRSRIQQAEIEEVNISDDPNLADLGFSQAESLLSDKSDYKAAPKQTFHSDTDLIVMHVMAQPQQQFYGYELLQALLAAGLRYGRMSIFHRYLEGSNTPLFSLASATEPGIFDINNMGAFVCSGLSLFMQIKGNPNPKHAFQLLLETAKQLAEDLKGELLDSQRQPLSDETINQLKLLVSNTDALAYAR